MDFKTNYWKSLYELEYGTPPDMNIIKVFGCYANMRIPDSLRKKSDPNCKRIIFLGYSTMGHHLLDPVTNDIVVSWNVQLNEEKKSCISVQDCFPVEDESPINYEVIPSLSDTESESKEKRSRLRGDVKFVAKLNDYFVYEANLTTLDSVSFEDIEHYQKKSKSYGKLHSCAMIFKSF